MKTRLQRKYTDYARGKDCTMRLDECARDPSRTAMCHTRWPGHGKMGGKNLPTEMFIGCDECHGRYDSRISHDYDRDWLWAQGERAAKETRYMMWRDGILNL